jgi:hypothetical protein
MVDFTKGPWIVNPLNAIVDAFSPGETVAVCKMLWPTEERSEFETMANAQLIAAAPDMYEAMKALERLWGVGCSSDKFVQHLRDEVMDDIRNAVSKAEGR